MRTWRLKVLRMFNRLNPLTSSSPNSVRVLYTIWSTETLVKSHICESKRFTLMMSATSNRQTQNGIVRKAQKTMYNTGQPTTAWNKWQKAEPSKRSMIKYTRNICARTYSYPQGLSSSARFSCKCPQSSTACQTGTSGWYSCPNTTLISIMSSSDRSTPTRTEQDSLQCSPLPERYTWYQPEGSNSWQLPN